MGSRGKGTRSGNTPLSPPDWVWQLQTGEYVPTHEWDMLLKGYENWHIVGASFISGKGQGPDYKNWGVTLPSVAMSLRRFDEGNSGGVVERDPRCVLGRGHCCVSGSHMPSAGNPICDGGKVSRRIRTKRRGNTSQKGANVCF